jgi:hypothetical protein
MLNFFAAGEENGEDREFMNQEFLKIRNQEDPYSYKYHSAVPDSLAYPDAEEAEKTLAIKDVEAWVEKWGLHRG